MKFLAAIVVLVGLLAPAGLGVANVQSVDQTDRLPDEYGVYSAVIGEMFAGNKVTFDNGGVNRVDLLLIESRTVPDEMAFPYPSNRLSFMKDRRPAVTPEPIRIVPSYARRQLQLRGSPENETLADYFDQNQQSIGLRRLFNLKVDYALIDSKETNPEAFRRDGKQVPGVVYFSRVGFNQARTQAVVYMGYVCGGLCGEGFSFFLVKEGDVWKVQRRRFLWIS